MLSGRIERVRLALAELAGRVGQEQWGLVAGCRRELEAARITAEIMEAGLRAGACPGSADSGRGLQ